MKNTFIAFSLTLLFISNSYSQRIPYLIDSLTPYGLTFEDVLYKWGKPTSMARNSSIFYSDDEYTTSFFFKNNSLASIKFGWYNITHEEATELFNEIKESLKNENSIMLSKNLARYRTPRHDIDIFKGNSDIKDRFKIDLIYKKRTDY